ncbi:MerR family transcriptional regulator [Psychrobacillus sp. FSL K6-2684]|uniref:MerR family transcriptional regulator n=1 Tax=Psychrobacillus sp. FSL K6-2843 TaxID=2921549 RepID=UPI0012A11530|nr:MULTISPECIES: MerR family transcriptional regulator [Psychrobacillus]QEY19567.1 MerR family transcriptional regulator [Psychrobacillus sp. AK 1817]
MGELAEKSGITKRTIDYYTTLGLLEAERSSSNYRYYPYDAIEKLRLIEEKKSDGMSLEQIKRELARDVVEEIDIQEIRLQMKYLEKEVSHLLEQINDKEDNTKHSIKQKVSTESVALMQSLLLLIT